MPANWAFIITYTVSFLFSIYVGFLLGQLICRRCAITVRDYWVCNGAGVAVAVLAVVFAPAQLIHVVVVGMLAGYIAGLKMSFGESTGPWKWLDKFMDVNRGHRNVAAAGTGEARRRRRKTGEQGPDLISVESKNASATTGAAAPARKDKKGKR